MFNRASCARTLNDQRAAHDAIPARARSFELEDRPHLMLINGLTKAAPSRDCYDRNKASDCKEHLAWIPEAVFFASAQRLFHANLPCVSGCAPSSRYRSLKAQCVSHVSNNVTEISAE